MSEPNRWVLVVVSRYPSPTNPVVVNVFGYPTKALAQAHERRTKKHARENDLDVIAIRVRPIIDDEFLAEKKAKASERMAAKA